MVHFDSLPTVFSSCSWDPAILSIPASAEVVLALKQTWRGVGGRPDGWEHLLVEAGLFEERSYEVSRERVGTCRVDMISHIS